MVWVRIRLICNTIWENKTKVSNLQRIWFVSEENSAGFRWLMGIIMFFIEGPVPAPFQKILASINSIQCKVVLFL